MSSNEYKFLVPSYDVKSMIITPTDVARKTGTSERIVFLDRHLGRQERLAVIVTGKDPKQDPQDVSFVFGLSTCDPSKIAHYRCHSHGPCGPLSECGGQSVLFNVRYCDRTSNYALFTRTGNSIVAQIGNVVTTLPDPCDILKCSAATPFIMLTGLVTSLGVLSQSRIPVNSRRLLQPQPQKPAFFELLLINAFKPITGRVGERSSRKRATVSSSFQSSPSSRRDAARAEETCRKRAKTESSRAGESGRKRAKIEPTGDELTGKKSNQTISADLVTSDRRKAPQDGEANGKRMTAANENNWLPNQFVDVSGSILTRIESDRDRNPYYVFRNALFELDQMLVFQVKELDDLQLDSLTFGLTRNPPLSVNFNGLPVDPESLTSNAFRLNWFIKPNIFESFGHPEDSQLVGLKRTMEGVSMKTGSAGEMTILEVDPTINVYPFFNLSAAVTSIEVIDFRVKRRTGTDCCVCLSTPADQVCNPCHHLFYCTACLKKAKLFSPVKCPCCKNVVTDFTQVFFH